MMHRELARLRSYQGEFSTIVHETAGAFDSVISAAQDHTATLGHLSELLSAKIEQAHEAIATLDARLNSSSQAKGGTHAENS
jgi:ABC-type transporter Mla subunit MlaD